MCPPSISAIQHADDTLVVPTFTISFYLELILIIGHWPLNIPFVDNPDLPMLYWALSQQNHTPYESPCQSTILAAIGALLFSGQPRANAEREILPGDLIRGQAFSAVYYYGNDGLRYVFPNSNTCALAWRGLQHRGVAFRFAVGSVFNRRATSPTSPVARA